ncbi:MAG: GNAT family N-acetyltransferase [Verrucomicrobia bacterium]|nr:GNAT family N-acetyltransferase [Verrucomicrobiota bacterium]MBS0636925.1 GNAT family N-acetyltransferase [Verrucomicrobiota bacterium]
MKYNISTATSKDLHALEGAITEYNVRAEPNLPLAQIFRLDFVAKDDRGALMGGIQAYWVNWGILHVELLYVYEEFRKRGIASMLLQHVEKIAKENNCHLAQLDTFDFQAKDFYLQHGYSIFGVLDNAPKGHKRFYMNKNL